MGAHARDLDNIDLATPADPFAPAMQSFDALVGRLKGPDTLNMRHGKVEQFLQQEGMEVLRQLFQSHIRLPPQATARRAAGQQADVDGVIGLQHRPVPAYP